MSRRRFSSCSARARSQSGDSGVTSRTRPRCHGPRDECANVAEDVPISTRQGTTTGVTTEPWVEPPRSRQRIVIGVLLIAGPLPLAGLLLVIGLFGSLVWVYLSIALSVLWLPCLVIGVLLIARRDRGGWRYTSPPG